MKLLICLLIVLTLGAFGQERPKAVLIDEVVFLRSHAVQGVV
jgi:hypothetical protein